MKVFGGGWIEGVEGDGDGEEEGGGGGERMVYFDEVGGRRG